MAAERPVHTLIRSDLYRYTGDASVGALLRQLLTNRGFRYSFWLRLCRSRNPALRLLARAVHWWMSDSCGIHIPRGTRIGCGLYLGHPVGLVVNHTAVIGDNCNLGQFTTIGSNHENAARIGNHVYIGPGVSLVEGVVIGDYATIGAGSVVVKDVPAGVTVAGNPARVVSHKEPGRYIANPWPAGAVAAAGAAWSIDPAEDGRLQSRTSPE